MRQADEPGAGTRGAISAENFIAAGYAVIFLHRTFSLLPYSRHYSHSFNCFLDFMTFDNDGRVIVGDEYQKQMAGVLQQYQRVKQENTLLLLAFTSVNEYLWELRELAKLLRPLGADAVLYLAAAVSDFFIPAEKMVEHKIQSSEDFNPHDADEGKVQSAARMNGQNLSISMDPVPKFLKNLVDEWAPEAMIISFKLETDPELLSTKAHYALKKYSHNLVIGNLLNTRKWEVLLVSADGADQWIRVPLERRSKSITAGREGALADVSKSEPAVEIESLIVPAVASLHSEHIARHNA